MRRAWCARTCLGWLSAIAAVTLAAGWSEAGLIIEVSPDIDAASIRDLAIDRGNLIVRYGRGESTIKLPSGAIERIANWVRRDVLGPVVVSGDEGFVPGLGGRYFPPQLDQDLGLALLDYDLYAVMVASGTL